MSGKSRIGICFVDLTNFLKAIFLNDIDSEYFFGFTKYFWIVPFRLPCALSVVSLSVLFDIERDQLLIGDGKY